MTIFGWDLSHYDGTDSRKAIDEGLTFFTHKAGGDADDVEIGPWWNLMKGYRGRVLLGAYWVLYPGRAVARADEFLARLDATCPGWRDGPFILQLDCEKWGGNAATLPSKADIKACCDRLRARMPKLIPIVYAPKWAYGDSLTGLGYPLWASSYVTGIGPAIRLYPGDASPRWGAYGGQVPAVLQYTSFAMIAGQSTCDANAFRGTLAQLAALLAPGWQEDEMNLTDTLGDSGPTVGVALQSGYQRAGLAAANSTIALARLDALNAKLDALAVKVSAPPQIDVRALAAALDPLLDGVTVTPEIIKEAFRQAFAGQ